MREWIEKFYLSVLRGEREGFFIRSFKAFLRFLSWLYRGLIQLRFFLYRIRVFPSRSITAWVISVGNLTLGGTGKTPVVERVARLLHSRGRKVAIVSRGYRRKTGPRLKRLKEKILGAPTTRVVSNGQNILLNARVAGDEPYMLAVNLPGIPVVVNRNRVKGALYAVRRLKADTIILDDGFQHLALKRDLDIVLIDSGDPFGNGRLFPGGILREPPQNLSRADLILLTKANENDPEPVKKELSAYLSQAEILSCRHSPVYLYDVRTSLKTTFDFIKGVKVATLAGIARPGEFEKLLGRMGAEVIYSRRFADHHFYSQQELIDVINEAQRHGAEILVTTEKDAVRFARLSPGGLPVYSLRVRIESLAEGEDFDQDLLRFLRRRKA